jgi:hypothetical protein
MGVSFLKALAEKEGFRLSLGDAKDAPRIRLLCHRAAYQKGKVRTTKTDCPFIVAIKNSKHLGCYVVSPKSCLQHNHEVQAPAAEDIAPDLQQMVRDMKRVGVANAQISDFVFMRSGSLLTCFDLARLVGEFHPEVLNLETEALISEMDEGGGCWWAYEVEVEGSTKRAAILTMTPEERDNLRHYGDVIFLDGTFIANELGWTTVPVVLINHQREIVSGGWLFTAVEQTEIYLWVLTTLNGEEPIQTLFTDEDSSLMCAFPEFQATLDRPVFHRICIWHKRRNFLKKLKERRVKESIAVKPSVTQARPPFAPSQLVPCTVLGLKPSCSAIRESPPPTFVASYRRKVSATFN